MLRFAARAGSAVVVSAAVAAAYVHVSYGPDTLPRIARAYSVGIPALFAYKRVQLLHDRWRRRLGLPVDDAANDREYEELHRRWAPLALDVILDLRGFNLKTGQLVASNFGNVFPKTWQKTFEILLDKVPHKPFAHVRATVERELGASLESLFATFDETPLAAASIGQVHRATLRDGHRVVVKVQYPEVEGLFRGDILAAKNFARIALPEHVAPLEEIEAQFANEFDYCREARQLALVRGNLAKSGAFPDIIVPAPLLNLTTKNVLVMEEVEDCEKLTTALERDMEFFAQQRGVPVEELLREENALNAAALKRGELRCGPSASEMRAWESQVRWRNFFAGVVGLAPIHVPLNHAELMDELLRVHGHEILIDGAFNGDPHPGNVLVVNAPGKKRRLALVDYGQVKILSKEQRLHLARLLVALARADADATPAQQKRIGELSRAMGWASARNDDEVAYLNSRLFFDRDDLLATNGKNTQAFLEDLEARDPRVSLNRDFVLVGRASLMLRGLGHMLNQHRSAAKAWSPIAESILRENGEDPDKVLLA